MNSRIALILQVKCGLSFILMRWVLFNSIFPILLTFPELHMSVGVLFEFSGFLPSSKNLPICTGYAKLLLNANQWVGLIQGVFLAHAQWSRGIGSNRIYWRLPSDQTRGTNLNLKFLCLPRFWRKLRLWNVLTGEVNQDPLQESPMLQRKRFSSFRRTMC